MTKSNFTMQVALRFNNHNHILTNFRSDLSLYSRKAMRRSPVSIKGMLSIWPMLSNMLLSKLS
jgi:hypothetical protein